MIDKSDFLKITMNNQKNFLEIFYSYPKYLQRLKHYTVFFETVVTFRAWMWSNSPKKSNSLLNFIVKIISDSRNFSFISHFSSLYCRNAIILSKTENKNIFFYIYLIIILNNFFSKKSKKKSFYYYLKRCFP